MARAENSIKIKVEDEDMESENLDSGALKKNEPIKISRRTTRKTNVNAKTKPVLESIAPIKTVKKTVRHTAAAVKAEKKITLAKEKAFSVKKGETSSKKPGNDKFDELKEIKSNRGINEKNSPSAPFAKVSAMSHDLVKGAIDASLKEKEAKKAVNDLANKTSSQRSVRLYKKIAMSFIFLTLAMLAAVAYFTLVKTTIVLIPNQERMSSNMLVDVYDKSKSAGVADNSITGVVSLTRMEEKVTYTASGTEVIGEEAVGRVKIINNYIKNQPLVAGTRLLTPDGIKLYRLKNTVNVPAGGSVEVEIYADEPSPDSNLGPTKFTIPGLWAGLQDKIYAENNEPIVYRQKLKRKVTQTDLDSARQDLRQKLAEKFKFAINDLYKEYDQVIYKIDEDSTQTRFSGKAGEEKETFEGTMQANVIAVAFNSEKVAELAMRKLVSSLPENKELLSFGKSNIIYSLNNYNYNNGIATISATFEGKVSLKENSQIIDVNKILGLNQKELDAYLAGLPDIAGYDVKFYPSFIKRVSNLVDRIKVEIKK